MDNTRFTIPLFFILFLLLFIVRLALSTQLNLSADEAYYYRWSQQLSFSYPDHPPMIAWLIRLGTTIIGPSEVGIRFFSALLGFIASIWVYLICRELQLSSLHCSLCALLGNLLLMPAVGSLLMTPDVPLAFFWLSATLLLTKLYHRPIRSLFYWLILPAVGACYSKHTGMLIFPLVFLTCIITPKLRPWLKSAHPWLALGISFVLICPWIFAEYQNDFPSILHQTAHAQGALPGSNVPWYLFPVRWLELLLGQFALLSPLVFIYCTKYLWKHRSVDSPLTPVVLAFFLPIAITLIVALRAHPEQNWASLGHPMAAVIAVFAIVNSPKFSKKFSWMLLWASILTIVAHAHAIRPFLPLPAYRDPVTRLHGWEPVAAAISNLNVKADAIVCDNYGLAAHLYWFQQSAATTVPIVGTNRQFQTPPAGNWIILDEQNDFGDFSPMGHCDSTRKLSNIHVQRNDERLRTIRVSWGENCYLPDNASGTKTISR